MTCKIQLQHQPDEKIQSSHRTSENNDQKDKWNGSNEVGAFKYFQNKKLFENKIYFFFSFWMTQHLPLRQLMKPVPTKVGLTALQVSNFYSVYFFLAGGIVIASTYFVVEITMVIK